MSGGETPTWLFWGDNRKRKRKCPAAGDAVNDLKDDGESSLSVHR